MMKTYAKVLIAIFSLLSLWFFAFSWSLNQHNGRDSLIVKVTEFVLYSPPLAYTHTLLTYILPSSDECGDIVIYDYDKKVNNNEEAALLIKDYISDPDKYNTYRNVTRYNNEERYNNFLNGVYFDNDTLIEEEFKKLNAEFNESEVSYSKGQRKYLFKNFIVERDGRLAVLPACMK